MRIKKNDFSKIFITGAGSGLGRQASITLSKRDFHVFAGVKNRSEIALFEKIIISEHLKIETFCCNILNKNEQKMIPELDVDILVCNAAIGDSGSVSEINVDRIIHCFNTNVFAHLDCIQLFIQDRIAKKKNGRIIILSSLIGRIPMPFLSPYCATKSALDCFATCLRQEMKILKKLKGIDIQVCIIEPGAYATGFNKENIEKKYEWMYDNSYFSGHVEQIKKIETKIWNFLEQKSFDSIVKQYVKAAEAKHPKHRYSAPWWQTMFVQLGRILGM